jgi:hypothetical protein
VTAAAEVPTRSNGAPLARRQWTGSRPRRRRSGPGPGTPGRRSGTTAGDGTAAVTVEIGHGDAEPHLGVGGGGRVDQDRVEHGAPRRVQGVHAKRRLDGDRHDGIGVAERGAAHRGRARRDDLVEQAPSGQLQHAAAHQGVRGEGVGTVAAAVDEEDAQPGAGQQVGGGRPRSTGADDNDVVAGVGRAVDWHGLSPGSAAGAGAGAGCGVMAGDVIGHERGVAVDAAEVRTR